MTMKASPNLFTDFTAAQSRLANIELHRAVAEEEAAALRADLETVTARITDLATEGKAAEDVAQSLKKQLDARQREWLKLTGGKYADLDVSSLSLGCREALQRFGAWTPAQTRTSPDAPADGMRFHGPRDAGVNDLIHELGRRLFLNGWDVLPTSGPAFEENQGNGSYVSRFAEAEVLVLADADAITSKPAAQALRAALQRRRDRGLPTLASTSRNAHSMDSAAGILREATAALPHDTSHIHAAATAAKAA